MEKDYRKTKAGERRFNNPKIYRESRRFQQILAENGIAWHNVFADECTADFSCCEGDGEYYVHLPSYYSMAKQLFTELFEQIRHGDQEHQDWLWQKMEHFLKTEVLHDEP